MLADLGGWLAPILTGYIATWLGWTPALDFAGVVTSLAGLFWIGVDARGNLEAEPAAPNGEAPCG